MLARCGFFLIAGCLLYRIKSEWNNLHHAAPELVWSDFHSVLVILRADTGSGTMRSQYQSGYLSSSVMIWQFHFNPCKSWNAQQYFVLTPKCLALWIFFNCDMNSEESTKKCSWCRHLAITNDLDYNCDILGIRSELIYLLWFIYIKWVSVFGYIPNTMRGESVDTSYILELSFDY